MADLTHRIAVEALVRMGKRLKAGPGGEPDQVHGRAFGKPLLSSSPAGSRSGLARP